MLGTLYRCTAKISITLLLIISLISLTAPSAAALNKPEDKNKESLHEERSPAANEAGASVAGADSVAASSRYPTIAYVLYKGATEPRPEMILPADQPQIEAILNRAANVKPSISTIIKTGTVKRLSTIPLPTNAPAASTAPMSAGEKFHSWVKRFWSPGAYGGAIARGMFNELFDNDDNKEDTVGNYFADSMTRAARSYAFGTTAGFFEKFAYATIFKQDPRYHRSDKRSAGAKIKYAVSRVFITQGDTCGCDQFNITFLAGGLTASGIANLWEREERRGWGPTMSRWGYHTAFKALGNMIREFIGGQ